MAILKTILIFRLKQLYFLKKKEISISLNSDNNYLIGGEIYNLPVDDNIMVFRAVDMGSGVPYLHVQIDIKPKYYKTEKFKIM